MILINYNIMMGEGGKREKGRVDPLEIYIILYI